MTNDKQRERLVELLIEYDTMRMMRHSIEDCADHLLANGVIVPPCKVGDEVYVVIKNMPFVPADVYECEVVWYALGKDGLRPTVLVKSDDNIIKGASLGVYIEDIYFTREEAEKALGGVQG